MGLACGTWELCLNSTSAIFSWDSLRSSVLPVFCRAEYRMFWCCGVCYVDYKVMIAAHIPPGFNSHLGLGYSEEGLWVSQYITRSAHNLSWGGPPTSVSYILNL